MLWKDLAARKGNEGQEIFKPLVKPAFEEFCLLTKNHADVILWESLGLLVSKSALGDLATLHFWLYLTCICLSKDLGAR